MNSPRLKKENNECQTDLQCTPFILNENETGKVQSSRLCQTVVQLSPRTPDTELYKIIPYIDDEDIEKNAVRFMSIIRNRNIKLQFILPSETSSYNNDSISTVSDDLNEKSNEDVYRSTSESSYEKENKEPKVEVVDSESSNGTLKSAIKKILRDDDSTQTDLMVAPHVLYNKEKATITIHNSCQTSLTCTPRTSLTEVVPMLKSYWEHQGEIREAFNKSENVLEILKEVIKDVIDIHQHMFDPNYNLPDMSTALVKLEPNNSLADSTDWDVLSHSKRMKKTIMDVGGDGSFGNTTLSDYRDDYDYKQSAITSSTFSDITTSFSSDYTLASTKDDETDVELDDDTEISEILGNLKKKYTSPVDGSSVKTQKGKTTDDDESPKCQMINSSCVCSGINIKLYLEDEFDKDNDENKIDRFIEMKIKPDLETIEIKKLVNISTDPELGKIRTTIPFQEIEKLIQGDQSNNDSIEKLAKLFAFEDQKEPLKINTLKSDGFQININIPKSTVLNPQTSSEDLLQTFLFANIPKDLQNAPHPDMLDKVSFPNQAKGCMNIDDKDNNQMQICPCDMPTDQKPVSETQSAFTAVFSRLYGDTEKFIPFHMDDPACECNYDAKDSEQEQLQKNINLDISSSVINSKNETAHILKKDNYFKPEINKKEDKFSLIANDPDEEIALKYISSHPIVPSQVPVKSNDEAPSANNLTLNKQGVVTTQDLYGTSTISYKGHIYKTDNFFLSCDSDDSVKSSATSVVIKPVRRKSRKQTIITYEEHMYKTDGLFSPPFSDTSLTDLECTCATKLKESLMECPHCFKRIGPQYGRGRHKKSDEYDQSFKLTNLAEFCATRQSPPEQNKYRSYESPSTMALSESEQSTSNNTCISKQNNTDFNLKETNNSEATEGSILDYNDSIERNSNTREIYSTKSDTTNKMYPSNNLIENYRISEGTIKENGDISESPRRYMDSTDRGRNVADIVKHSPNREYGKSANKYGKSGDIDTPSLAKMIPDKNDKYKGTIKTKCLTCPKAIRNKNLFMDPLQVTSPSANIIADKNEKHITKSLTKCQTCSKAKLNKTCSKNLTTAYDTPSLDKIIAEMEEKYIAISKTKCQTCSKAKLNDASNNNLKIVQIYETRSTCSSKDQLVEKRECAATFNNFACSATCNKSNNSSGIMLEGKVPIVNLQKLMQMEEKLRTQQNKNNAQDSRKKCLSCSNLVNKDSHISSKSNNQDNFSKSLTAPKTKCSTCKKSLKSGNTIQVIYPPKSKSLNCTCVKSKCGLAQNMEETVCLMEEKSTHNSIKSNSTCAANKEKSIQNICSQIHNSQPKYKLENIPEFQCKQNNTECPEPPCSLESNCKCKNCILINDLNEVNKSHHSSQCQKLPHCSVQKILEKNLPCSCSSSSTNLKEGDLGPNLDSLTNKPTPCFSKCNQNKDTSKCTTSAKDIQRSEIVSASGSNSKIKQNEEYCTKNMCLIKEEKMVNHEIKERDLQSTYECLPCLNLLNKDSHISTTINQDNSWKSSRAPKSESFICSSVKGKCDLSQNKKEKACLMDGESTQNSIKNNDSTCEANKESSVQNICSLIHHSKLKFQLENITQCRQKNAEYPRTPSNSLRSNCNCSNCIFYNDINEFNKSGHSSQCQKLTHCSIQKILEKNLPCSCTSSSTNQKEDNLGTDLDCLSLKQNIDTSKSSNENVKDKIQETIMLSEEIMLASDSDSKIKQNDKYSTANIIRLMKDEKMFNNDIVNTDMLSNLSITIQPKVQILDAPKYTYKIYNCASNGEFILDTNNNEKIFFYNSLDDFNNTNSCAKSVDFSREEFLLAKGTKSDTHINDELKKSYFSSKTTQDKSKILHIHELEGKYSVFSIEKKNKSNESQNTVYILPNAVFSSLVSTPPPEFLRELTESQIDDIIHYSHVRKIHYERNPEFDQETNATMSSNNNSEQFVNSIANNNLPSMRQTTCSCSLSVPRNQEQQTDKIFNDVKADKATSYTSLQKNENKVHNSVGIQSSYLLFDSSQSEKTVSSLQKESFETNEFPNVNPNNDNVKETENTLHKRESNPLHTLGKYITWDDLIKPKLYNPTPVQNAITSLEPLITRTNQKEDRSNQTSNLSFLNLLSEPSFKSPLTIEASTSTDYLEAEGSMITSPGYHLSENFSIVDLPVSYPTASDYSVTAKNQLLGKNMFQTPSVRTVLKKTYFPTLTLEASTSTTSTNEEQKIFTPSSTKKSISLANVSLLDKNLNEKETTPMCKYEESVKTSTFKSPTKETLSSTFQNTALERSSLIREAPTSKIPIYIGIPLPSSPNIASSHVNSLPESLPGLLEKSHETSINDIPPFTSLTKFALSKRPVLQEPNPQNVDNYTQISLTKDQISCISLPKVESLYSISEPNCLMTDTDTNFPKNNLNNQGWSYPQEKEIHNSRKFIHGTDPPASEHFIHSTENVLISVNSKHDDTSVSKNNPPLQYEAILKPESAKDINKQDSSIFESYGSTALKAKEVVHDKSFDTKLFSNNTPKLNSLESSITSDKNYIHFGSSIPNEDHKLYSSTNENDHKVGFQKCTKYNEELKDSPLNTSTSTLQEEPGNKFHEHMQKNLQIERLLSKAIDAYAEYLTLKKGISSKLNISQIDLVYPNTDSHVYSKYTEEEEKYVWKKNQPIQHSFREILTDSLTSKSDDYNFDYLKTKDSNLDYIKKSGKNPLKLSDTSVEPDKIHNSSEEFLAQTEKAYSQILQQKKESSKISKISVSNSYSSSENSSKDLQTDTNLTKKSSSYQCSGEDFLLQIEKAYSKVLQRKEELLKFSVSNIFSSFENSSKDLQTETNPTKKSSSFQYSLSSDASSIIDFKQDSFSSKTSEQDTEFSSLRKDQATNVKSNIYKDVRSDKFLSKEDNNGSASSKGEEEISTLSRDLHKTEEDANIKSENSEIVKNKSTVYSKAFKNNPSLFMFENKDNYLRRSKKEKNKFLSPLSSVNDNNLAQDSLALRESNYKDVIVNKNKDDHGKINKDNNEINLKKTNLSFKYSNNVKPNTSKDLKLETSMYNPKDNSAYTALEKELSEKTTYRKVATPYQSSRGSTELKTNDYSTYAKKEEYISPIQSASTFSPTYLNSISENRNSIDLKSNDYSTYSKKENNVYPRKSTSKIVAPYSNYAAETINSRNLKYSRKEENVSPGISTHENASLYPHVDNNRSRNLKSNNFSTYLKKEETISSSSKRASFYLPNVAGSKNFSILKSKDLSMYPKNEETLSTRISTRQSPHNIVEVKSRNIKPNNYSTYPKQEEAISPIQSTSIFEPTTLSISENKDDYSTNTRKTETFSSRRPTFKSALAYPYSDLDNKSSSNLKSNAYSTYQKKEETSISAPTYPHNISDHESYKKLKPNDYSSNSKKEETRFPRVPTLQNASLYPPSISENRSYLNLDLNNYSTYSRKDETFSPRRSNYKNALAYPHSDLESRNLKSNDNSTYLRKAETFSSGRSTSKSALVYPYSNLDNSSSRNLKSNDYSTNRKKEGSISPIQGSIIFPPIYPHFISENKSYRDLKSIENSTYSRKEQIYSPRMSIVQNDSLHPHSGLENRSSINLKSNQKSTHSRIEESFSSRRSYSKSVLDFSHSELENRSSKDLKSNDYSTYPIKEEIITSRRLTSKSVLPNPHSILKIRSSRNLISNDYSSYPEDEEDTYPIISAPQSTLYPYSIIDKRSSRILNSNEFIYKPESQSKIPEIENDLLNSVVNNNTANMKNSATSKLSLFVRNGEVNELLSNIGDSTQQLPIEKLNHIRPDVAVSGHRVLEAVQSCGQRLQPIKIALKNIKMQLKELNMPEVNGMLETDHLTDENKAYIYLPPPPAPWVGNRCTYRTKMTFQLKQPIKPVSVTENVNPFSIKHKYILNDAERNHAILNANYSSLSDPPHHVQRKSIDSISQNFNQASYSESKPIHSSRYHPDTYYERSHTIQKPLKIIEEDTSFFPEDLKGSRSAIDDFEQYQYLPNNNNFYNYYQPRTESLNNYVVFPKPLESSIVYVPAPNSFYKPEEHVHGNYNGQNNVNMFTTGDYPLWKN